MNKPLSDPEVQSLLVVLEKRYRENGFRHPTLTWEEVRQRLEAAPHHLSALLAMESSGGEPDVVELESTTGKVVFYDCAPESPAGRRSLCYDREAWLKRKANKPAGSAIEMAEHMGVELLTESEYLALQAMEPFDLKTSSWLKTPSDLRLKGGALFGDCRYGRAFIYVNGADSYYAVRGFRVRLSLESPN